MEINREKVLKVLNPRNIWMPVFLGLGIVLLLFYRTPNITYADLNFIFNAKISSILIAFLVLFARDLGYIYRIRTITNKELNWKKSFYIIILWEFASAVTPSVVGGTAIIVFVLTTEGIKFGKSLAYVMLTAILDNLFFVIATPIVILLTNENIFPKISAANLEFGNSLRFFFYLSYTLIAIYTLLMSFGLLVKPRAFKWLLLKVTSIKYLSKWKQKATEYGNQIILASKEMVGKDLKYWLLVSGSTIFVWCARYLMLNSLVMAYIDISFSDNMIIFSRQIIMWITMLISPTPGSSGTAEYFFTQFFSEFLHQYTFILAVFWRLMSYYPYLLAGAIILPWWLKRTFKKNE